MQYGLYCCVSDFQYTVFTIYLIVTRLFWTVFFIQFIVDMCFSLIPIYFFIVLPNWFLDSLNCFPISVFCFHFWIDCVIVGYCSMCVFRWLIVFWNTLTFTVYFSITLLIVSIENFHSILEIFFSIFWEKFWKFNSPPPLPYWTRPKLCFQNQVKTWKLLIKIVQKID